MTEDRYLDWWWGIVIAVTGIVAMSLLVAVVLTEIQGVPVQTSETRACND